MVALDRRWLAVVAQQSVFQPANGRRLVLGEMDTVALFRQSRQQWPVERGMAAERGRQGRIARICDCETHIQVHVIGGVGDGEAKREWKVLMACRVVSQSKCAGFLVAFVEL